MMNKCRKHGQDFPLEIKSNGRCSLCHRETANIKRNTDPVTKAARNAKVARLRAEHPEKYRALDKKYKAVWMPKGYRFREVLKSRRLTMIQYEEMVKEHDNKCGICGSKETRKCSKNPGKISRLVIDHCHKTNKVRGLLCHSCNTAIGKFKENIEIMYNAMAYVEHWNNI